QAHGTETLYYHTSKKGKALAGAVQKHIVKALGLRDRGIKSRQAEDRGGYLLRYTQAPCVIVEPGFLSNDYDFEILNERKAQYCQALVAAATEYARDFGLV
ncbi:N-acetylmuramoyl-L-alanine amidase, partial [Vibrio scophthalmi]